ncbi:GspH/FimT family pseudopilin [Aliamphritea spongicola]|uniref:GspH/FimT family pseudopilin n=1 Tax=Aliamphritea spongicola TaxID=707589 RepID=UPI00196AF343|nr:GspH/FimT family pseudopilin [Aliamphritea spongicola]MBN3562484.1 GspH/FimT family pseudopilin [Aliamphritea spongicola]
MDYSSQNIQARKLYSGFTLIELLITLAVASILLTVAVPGFSGFFQDNLLRTQIQSLHTAIAFARDEAVRRGVSVSVCGSTPNQAGCDGSWHNGWLVFTDPDENGVLDAGDSRLRVWEGIEPNRLIYSNVLSYVGFDSQGFLQQRQDNRDLAGTFMLCDDRGAPEARGIQISSNGRSRMAPGGIVCP